MTDEELFEQAKVLEVGETHAFLLANAEDQSQAVRVKKLLSADRSPDSLLDTTAMQDLDSRVATANLPKSIGDFEILRELGRGGMGVVYEARQKSLKRKVALKVLSSGLGLSSKAILRFRREAEAAGKLHHTNIVPIYTTGEDKGVHFYAMERIDGPSLDHVIKERCTTFRVDSQKVRNGFLLTEVPVAETANEGAARRDDDGALYKIGEIGSSISTSSGSNYFDTVATMIADVAEALDHAHEHGVVHRDVKPSNLLLGPDGRLSINDFGLARMLEQPGMTVSGEFVGSPLYMSPEQITAGRVQLDHRTDIYSLGATLYELLAHQPPFPGQSRDQVLSQILHKEPVSTRKINRKVPLDLDTICMKAIEKDPDRRYQTAAKLADDLRKYVNRHAISARRTSVLRKGARWLKRHPSQAVLTVLLTVALVAAYRSYLDNRKSKLEHAQELHLISCLGGDTESSKRHMLEAEKYGATEGWLMLAEGQIKLYEGEYDAAFKLLKNALKHKAPKIPTRTNLTIVQLFSGDEKAHENELKYLKRLLRDDELVPKSPQDYLYLAMAFQYAEPHRALHYLEKSNQSGEVYDWIRASVCTWAAIYETDERIAVDYAQLAQAAARSLSDTYPDNPRTAFNGIWAETVASICYRRAGDFERQRKAIETAKVYIELTKDHPAANLQMARYLLLDETAEKSEQVSEFLISLGNGDIDYYTQTYRMIDCIRTGNVTQVDRDYAASNGDQSFRYPLVALARLSKATDKDEVESIRRDFQRVCRGVVDRHSGEVFHADLFWAAAKILDLPDEVKLCEREVQLRANTFKDSYVEASRMAIVEVSRGQRVDSEPREGEDRRVLTYLLFALGVESLSKGDRVTARKHFEACSREGNPGYYVCQFARAVLARWDRKDDSWPRSILERSGATSRDAIGFENTGSVGEVNNE